MTIRSNTRIRKGGELVGSADELNLIEGAGVTITAASVAPRDVDVTIAATAGAGGAPTDADYLVGTANGDLSGEIVVGTTPGGELGNTWASPTVDATHSGSTHAAAQAAAEATAATALSTHEADTTSIHGISDTSALETTTGSQTKVDTHVNDTGDAHDASAVSFAPAGTIAATDVQAAIEEVASEAGGGGAPTDADYLVGTANGSLSAEIVVGTTPGGELGGTWGSPTVDATHSGSAHHTQAHAIDGADHTGDIETAQIANDAVTYAKIQDVSATDRLLGRDTAGAGVIEELDATAVRTMLDVPTNAQAILDAILDAAGDLIIGSAADTPARLARGTAGDVLESTATTVAWRTLYLPVTFSKTGTLTTGTGATRWYNDTGRTLTISSVRASVGTAPTGASLIVDVHKAGTTIYTTQASRPEIAISGNTDEGAAPDVTTIADADYFTVDIDQVGSTVAGADLTVSIWLSG